MASDKDMDEIVDLRLRRKPEMRVKADDLRGSPVLAHLPEFMAQLARANHDLETGVVKTPLSQVEVDAEDADDEDDGVGGAQPHVEMDIYAGVLEEQKEEEFEMKVPTSARMPATRQKRSRKRGHDNSDDGSDAAETGASSGPASSSISHRRKRVIIKNSAPAPKTTTHGNENETSTTSTSTSSDSSPSSSSGSSGSRHVKIKIVNRQTSSRTAEHTASSHSGSGESGGSSSSSSASGSSAPKKMKWIIFKAKQSRPAQKAKQEDDEEDHPPEPSARPLIEEIE